MFLNDLYLKMVEPPRESNGCSVFWSNLWAYFVQACIDAGCKWLEYRIDPFCNIEKEKTE